MDKVLRFFTLCLDKTGTITEGNMDIWAQLEQERIAAEKAEQERKRGVSQTINAIRDSMGEQAYIELDSASGAITLGDAAFERGSACLNESIENTLKQKIAPIISKVLQDPAHSNILVYIEGHTDNIPVKGISADIKKCALFDDNYSLSAGRAREARKAILAEVLNDTSISRRIAVVGYGPDKPIADNKTKAGRAKNRRVEFNITFEEVKIEIIYDRVQQDTTAAPTAADSIQAPVANVQGDSIKIQQTTVAQ